jgi:hypothetical protein
MRYKPEKIIDSHYYRNTVPMSAKNMVTGLLSVLILLALVYLIDPTFFGLLKRKSGFTGVMGPMPSATGEAGVGQHNRGSVDRKNVVGNPNAAGGDLKASAFPAPSTTQGFQDLSTMEGPADFGNTEAPAGCYPRDQLMPGELLPKDTNSVWAEQNPMGPGSLKGKNFLSAGALIGVNTVGQSLRNANWQFRSEPPNPQVPVSIFNQSTIQPDVNRRPLEIN